ncbi:hypothetical protein [Geminicoccus roseus]|uniref:hypothetical protein n=1 Tax=Geminicoccus roseus TaxID=404900 RepID=UPI00041564E7|nr:hypothetical protein [Geminicoccus roseus]
MAAHDRFQAIVVFEDRAESRWLSWLRPGFRHCYCLVRAERGWILVDPLLHDLRVAWLDLPDQFDLVEHYVQQGRIVLAGFAENSGFGASTFRPVTCVEIVKRTLGLGRAAAWTPYQLHRVLLARGWQRFL